MSSTAIDANQVDTDNLDLAGTPASLNSAEHVLGTLGTLAAFGIRDPGSGIGGSHCSTSGAGLRTPNPGPRFPFECRVFAPHDVEEVRVHDPPRVALRTHDAGIQPKRFVAKPRHQIERMGDEHHRAAAPAELGEFVEALMREGLVTHGKHFVDTKPIVCWQLPIRTIDRDEEDESVTTVLTEFGRDGWGEGGEEFAWWCTEAKEAFTGAEPVYKSMEAELRATLGDDVYEQVCKYMDTRLSGAAPPLPHPAEVPVTLGRTRIRRP